MPESKEHQLHPLAPLQPDEIRSAVRIIKQHNVNQTYKLQFKGIILHEPPRKLVIDFLKAEQGGESPQGRPPRIVRLHFYFLQAELPLHEAEVDVTNGKLVYQQALAAEFHGSTDEAEQILLTEIAMQSQEYKQEIQRLRLPEGTKVVGESWMYGTDSDVDERRKYQIYFYIAGLPNHPEHPQFNHYSLPLDFTVIIDCITHKIEGVERLPRTFDGGYPDDNTPWDAAEPVQYAHDLVGPLREDLKPIQVIQPEGPSFKIDGNRVSWQKWSFLVGFNYREGPTVHTITYDGRPIMYRASLSEMTVPYTDPRSPYHRKSAFDLGDCGGGLCTNSLSLGCDCLGTIAYFPGCVYSSDGEPVTIDNAVCMHEVDTGVSWKHTNFRNGQATVVRGRELVLQSIFTLANYEYAVYFIFDTAAAFHVEVKATGIMSTNPTQANQLLCDYGLVVGPGVFAPSHQHLFNFRFDMAVDGWDQTSVAYEETHPMAKDEKNIHGIGARYTSTKVEKASHLDADPYANRIVKFYNPNKINPICGKPVAYKFAPMATQMLLAHPTSHHARRAEFAHHHMSFTQSADLELFSGGEFTNQGRGGHGLLKWVERGDDLAGQPVLWHTIGMTHNPRMEDWPVMPQETMRLSFKPANFFDRNPAWDVPSSTERSTASVKAACNAANVVNGVNGVNGSTSSH